MTLLFRFAAAVSIAALPTQAMAQAKAPKCLTRPELRTAIAYLMPTIVNAAVERCRPALSSNDYLAARGTALVERYRGTGGGLDREITALIQRFMPMPGGKALEGPAAKGLIDAAIGFAIQGEIKDKDCSDISQAMSYLDPLPAANMAGLLEFVAVKVNDSNAKKAALAAANPNTRGKTRDKPFLCPGAGQAR